MHVDKDTIERFRAEGHAVVRGLAPRHEIEAYRPIIGQVVNEVAQRNDPQGRIDDYSQLFTQVTNIWRLNDETRRIVFDRRFAAAAADLLGVSSVRLYHDQALFKPAGAARTPWHQDRYYWPLDTDLTVTMWLPLVDVTVEMGPMIFASGSHRVSAPGDVAISEETDQRIARFVEEQGWPIASEPIPAGDATFHLGKTLHSAGANRSDRTREILTVIYYAADARASFPANDNQQVDLEVFLPGVKPGEAAASAMNPVLFP
jgi:ectoine hydroxylase-related dioxygenase (phytanoyl-CoA dioxygenase family)